MAADLGWGHFLWAGTLIMFLQMKFKFSKNFEQFMILHKISRFFWTGLLCFSSKSLYPESVTAATFTLSKIKGLLIALECL